MNNEPVAWRCNKFYENQDGWFYNENGIGEPLYTHPVKELDEQFKKGFEAGKEEGWKAHKFHHPVKELTAQEVMEQTHKKISEAHWKVKELTDEEIEEFEWLIKKQFNFSTGEKVPNLDRIIRAILRKAQEK